MLCSSVYERPRPKSDDEQLTFYRKTLIQFFNYLSRKEAYVLPFNVFSKSHLQQSQSHMESLYDVAFSCKGMISARRFSSWHLTLQIRIFNCECLNRNSPLWFEISQALCFEVFERSSSNEQHRARSTSDTLASLWSSP